MEENRPAYWSYTADKRFEPVKAIKTHNPSLVYRIPEPPRTSSRAIATAPMSSSTYALSTWRASDREIKRKKRVATYKAYAMEGKVKASIRSSFRWVKNKYSSLVHGC
ncbi:hypothetical protein RHSIM_Rhsim04G0232400 [Rhododendron simsii]|uniref:DUF3511 domain protein n=1 Tax=Rhododendron simsii TaxID=118357 RepID=A0A834H321_RHOSS|nr:hypothetical protein RHSIM_Rhsim04G0232400 [Rhododendron simsii]